MKYIKDKFDGCFWPIAVSVCIIIWWWIIT